MSDNLKVTDKYPSLVFSGYIDTVKGERLTAGYPDPLLILDITIVVLVTYSQDWTYGILRNGLIMIVPVYDSAEACSLCLKFEHLSGDRVAKNCRCVEESCRPWTEDRVRTLVGGNS